MPRLGEVSHVRLTPEIPLFRLLFLLSLIPSVALAAPCGVSTELLPAPYDGLVRGEEALSEGDVSRAITELTEMGTPPAGPASRRRAVLLGKAHILAGDPQAGKAVLRPVLSGAHGKPGAGVSPCDGDPAEARWWLAQASVRSREYDVAVPVWRTIWTHNPTSPWSEKAEDLLLRHDPAFTGADQRVLSLARAEALSGLNLHKRALTLLEARVSDDGTEEHKRRTARALFRAREYRRAVQGFAALQSPEPQDSFDRALAASRYGDYAVAAELYTALVDKHLGGDGGGKIKRLVDTASFKIGYLDYDAGRLDKGLAHFAAHLRRVPKSRHADEAHWFTGWSLFKQGRTAESKAAFRRLVSEHGRSSLAAGARYWTARIAGLEGDSAGEVQGLERVLRDHPDSSYAWWSARSLGRTWEAPEVGPSPRGDGAEPPALKRGIDLLRAGIDDWAAAELRSLTQSARKKGRDQTLYLAGRLVEAGEWAEARKLARPYCGDAEKREDLVALRICWPRPEYERAAAGIGGRLPALLPYAIMRAESGYSPTISSAAGARGLMQLMPELAIKLHARLHPAERDSLDPDRLFEAATNVELGVAELASLADNLADTGTTPTLPLVIAGYNGGEAAVRRWLGEQPTPVQADRWAEDIGYSETRRYVRKVLGTLQIYRYVYGD